MQEETEKSKLDGWISYTYSVSKRTIGDIMTIGQFEEYEDIDPNKYFYADKDQTHNLSVVLNYKFYDWTITADFRYNTGHPYTPIVSSVSQVVGTETLYYPVYGEYNSGRKPDYHRLDLKFEKEKKLKTKTLVYYFQILNVFNRKNVYDYNYSEDYSEKRSSEMFGMLILGGITIKF